MTAVPARILQSPPASVLLLPLVERAVPEERPRGQGSEGEEVIRLGEAAPAGLELALPEKAARGPRERRGLPEEPDSQESAPGFSAENPG